MRTWSDKFVAAGLRLAVEGRAPCAGAKVGTARRAVPALGVAGGTCSGASVAIKGVAPLHAARTSQRDVPTTKFRYDGCRYTRGFTLIEIIGVTAVIAALAALIAPSIIRRVDRAAWTRETADLNSIADAYTQSILRTKTIPSFTNLASAVASEMSLPVSAVTTNARR